MENARYFGFSVLLLICVLIYRKHVPAPYYIEIGKREYTPPAHQWDSTESCPVIKQTESAPSSAYNNGKVFFAGRQELYGGGYDSIGRAERGYHSYKEWGARHLSGAIKRQFMVWKKEYIKDWVDSMSGKAMTIAKKFDIPPSVILAQAYVESMTGQSRLSVTANNLFGHKYKQSDSKKRGIKGYMIAHDDSPTDRFRVFESHYWSLYHHGQLLDKSYRPHLVKADIPVREQWMGALCGCPDKRMRAADAGKTRWMYASACKWKANDGKTSKYVASLRYIIRLYNLEKLDIEWQRTRR